jgi:hypothetical protein
MPLLLLALALSAQAPAPDAYPCTIARAERVSFAEIHRDGARLQGRCIAVRGIWAGRALYDGEAASRAPRAESDAATLASRIGLAGSRAIERGARWPDAYVAVGVLLDCAMLPEPAGDAAGYCQINTAGPVMAVTELRRRHWPTLRGIW